MTDMQTIIVLAAVAVISLAVTLYLARRLHQAQVSNGKADEQLREKFEENLKLNNRIQALTLRRDGRGRFLPHVGK